MKNMSRIAVLSMATAMLTFCLPRVSYACEEAVNLNPDPAPTPAQLVAGAEKALESNPAEAARLVFTHFSGVRTAVPGKDPIKTRALRVLAIAIVRTNGTATERSLMWVGTDTWKPAANLEWAVQALREIEQVRPNDPAVQADLGEALSKLPHGKAKALEILERLAQKDLMGSPNAYAALATLKQEKGDTAGAQAAMSRCREMGGKSAAATCKVVAAKA
jgi:predicted Zn-dependent protease